MKKYLSILGLLAIFSQPVFAQCASCNLGYTYESYNYLPAQQVVALPIAESCAPACSSCHQVFTGAACPVCNSCMSGAACPTCNTCISGAACPIKQEFKKPLRTGAACPLQKKKMPRHKYSCKCHRIR